MTDDFGTALVVGCPAPAACVCTCAWIGVLKGGLAFITQVLKRSKKRSMGSIPLIHAPCRFQRRDGDQAVQPSIDAIRALSIAPVSIDVTTTAAPMAAA